MIEIMKNKQGFTLAEVLITLSIIGIVAAITIQIFYVDIINMGLKEKLKKEYSALKNGVLAVSNEEGFLGNNYPRSTYKDKLKQHFVLHKDCSPNCFSNEDLENIYKTHAKKVINTYLFDEGQFFLEDGSFIMIENFNPDRLFISVDVNGPGKKPDVWGIDLFTFELLPDGRLIPSGMPNTNYSNSTLYCSNTSSHHHNGIGCTYYALFDENYWKKVKK